MRIAVSGTHRTGKTTLVEALGARLPDHKIVPEPYEVLEERGYVFAHPPSIEDFIIQLRLSLVTLRRRSPNLILDRCPLDFLGYIEASSSADRFDFAAWRDPIIQAMKRLDLLVAVHADPAHDPIGSIEDAAFRLAVDERLRDIIDNDCFNLLEGVDVLILDDPWDRRVATVLTYLDDLRRRHPRSHPSAGF